MEFDLFKEWIPSINEKTSYLFDEVGGADIKYPSFMINKAMSQYEDTVFVANVMNEYAQVLDPKLQYDFYFHVVPKGRRFSKWAKAQSSDKVNTISKVYNISMKKAEEIADLFEESDLENMKEYLSVGGKNGNKN